MEYVVKATCDCCGDVDLWATEINWWMGRDADDGHLMFRCPNCSRLYVRDVGRFTLSQLRLAAAPRWSPENAEPRPPGPPLSERDLLAFRQGLRVDWWPEVSDVS